MKVRSSKADLAADKSPRGVDSAVKKAAETADGDGVGVGVGVSRKISLREFSDVEFPQRAKVLKEKPSSPTLITFKAP